MEGKDLEGVGNKETGETDVVKDAKEPNKDDLSVAGAGVCVLHTTVRLLVSWGGGDARVLVDGTDNGPAGKGGHHAGDGYEEERTTTELVDAECGSDGNGEIENSPSSRELLGFNCQWTVFTGKGIGKTYSKLLVLVLDTGTLVDDINVVGKQGVARVLRDDTQGDDDGESPAVATGSEKVHVRGGSLGRAVGLDGLLDLTVLELDSGVVNVAAGVVLGEDLEGLLRLVLMDEISRRLGNPPNTTELDDGGDGLDEGDRSPGPLAVDGCSTPADDGDDCQ